MKVSEYFLFDPRGEYLDPPLQGFRLAGGEYIPIGPVDGRLPSQVLGLHLERDGQRLRFFNPATDEHLLTRLEALEAAERRAADEHQLALAAEQRAADERQRALAAEAARQSLAEEIDRLRRENEALRGG